MFIHFWMECSVLWLLYLLCLKHFSTSSVHSESGLLKSSIVVSVCLSLQVGCCLPYVFDILTVSENMFVMVISSYYFVLYLLVCLKVYFISRYLYILGFFFFSVCVYRCLDCLLICSRVIYFTISPNLLYMCSLKQTKSLTDQLFNYLVTQSL